MLRRPLTADEFEDWMDPVARHDRSRMQTLVECCYRILAHRQQPKEGGVGVNLSGIAETLQAVGDELEKLGLVWVEP